MAIPFAAVALKFGPYELTAILLFSLVFIAGMTAGSMLKGLISGALGIRLGSLGLDLESGSQRMTFGFPELMDGVPLIAVAIGTLALSEMVVQLDRVRSTPAAQRIVIGRSPEDRMTWPIFRSCVPMILRGTAIGACVGFLPGLGASVASFVSYAATRTASKTPDRFGTGMPQGIAASESAENAVVPASFIPLFGLGLVGLRIFAQTTRVSDRVIVPMVIYLCLAGAALQGYGMKRLDYSFVAFIVAPMLELNLQQSLVLSRGDPMILLERSIALVFLLLTLAGLWQFGTSRRRLNIAAPRPQPAPRSETERT